MIPGDLGRHQLPRKTIDFGPTARQSSPKPRRLSMIDYEKIAESVEVPGHSPGGPTAFAGDSSTDTPKPLDMAAAAKAAAETIHADPRPAAPESPLDPEVAQRMVNRQYLPLNHEKYQGIAESKGYSQEVKRLTRVHYSHEAMIDVLIAEPTITQRELAKRFERSENWVSIIMGSDAFQAALAKRRDDLTDPFLIATIEERFRGLAQQSLQVIAENLEKTRNTDLALKALDISSKALGFGARSAGGPTVQNNFVVQLPPKIDNSAEWAKAHSSGPIIDQERISNASH